MLAGRTPGQDIISLLEPVYGRLHWSLIRIQKNVVLNPAEGDLVHVLLACVQAEPGNGHRLERCQDTTTGRVSDALTV